MLLNDSGYRVIYLQFVKPKSYSICHSNQYLRTVVDSLLNFTVFPGTFSSVTSSAFPTSSSTQRKNVSCGYFEHTVGYVCTFITGINVNHGRNIRYRPCPECYFLEFESQIHPQYPREHHLDGFASAHGGINHPRSLGTRLSCALLGGILVRRGHLRGVGEGGGVEDGEGVQVVWKGQRPGKERGEGGRVRGQLETLFLVGRAVEWTVRCPASAFVGEIVDLGLDIQTYSCRPAK